MTIIHLKQTHQLGFQKARAVACAWAEEAETKLSMSCHYEEGDHVDCVSFKRSGVAGTLLVYPHEFEINAKLGLLFSPFKERIETEIIQHLNAQLNDA